MMEFLLALGLHHGPTAALAMAVAYFGNRHYKADTERHEALELRTRALENDRVVQADIKRLEDQMEAGFKESRAQNQEILRQLMK